MTRSLLILPRADAGCGRAFFPDRKTAEGHRVALEFWNRATGRLHDGYRLAAYRCKRCGGFHVGLKRISAAEVAIGRHGAPSADHEETSEQATVLQRG
jgi:hypothetical protein